MDDQDIQDILDCPKIQQRVAVVTAVLACVPLAGAAATHLLSGRGPTITPYVAGEAFGVSGFVEYSFGAGKGWISFLTQPVAKWLLQAGYVLK